MNETKKELNDFLIPIRRHLHMYPEVGFDTANTAKYLKDILDKLGYETYLVINNSGVIAKLKLGKEKTIAFRSDIDALPIEEKTNLSYTSRNKYMHACGHDAHMAILLTSAYLFKKHQNDLKYNITLIFQPSEEFMPGGALQVIDTNLINDCSMFFAYHVSNLFYSKNIAIKRHETCAAPDLWELKINGKGGHGASPKTAINPLLIASEIALEYENFYQNELKRNPNIVITSTYLHTGVSMNIIPDTSYLKGTARSFNDETRKYLHKSLVDIAQDIANKYHATTEFNFIYAYDPVYNDDEAIDKVKKACDALNVKVIDCNKPLLIGDDFSYYRRIAPTSYTWLGVRGENQEFYDLHSPKFLLDEENLYIGALVNLEIAK